MNLNAEQFLISKLMPSLKNKLATAMLKMSEQFCYVLNNSLITNNLIKMLLLQVIIKSKIRLTINHYESFENNEFFQKFERFT